MGGGAEPTTHCTLGIGERIARATRARRSRAPPYTPAGTALVSSVTLPAAGDRVRFATRSRKRCGARAPSDGVTFPCACCRRRPVGEQGEVLYDNTRVQKWFDARWPGPIRRAQNPLHSCRTRGRRATTCYQSYWSEPTLIAGTPRSPAPFPPRRRPSRTIGVAVAATVLTRSRLARQPRISTARWEMGATSDLLQRFRVRVGGTCCATRCRQRVLTAAEFPRGANASGIASPAAGALTWSPNWWVDDGVLRRRFGWRTGRRPNPWEVVPA